MIDIVAIKERFETLAPYLDERARRLFAATETRAAGWGGVAVVSKATGGGRKPKIETEPGLLEALEQLVQSAIRGDPKAALLWVSRSQPHLVQALAELGFTASQKLVGRLLRSLGFSLHANRKTREGSAHPDRDAQFETINEKIKQFQKAGQPAISVDTKKKELVGDFKNGGRELRAKGDPEPVRVHDFKYPSLARLHPTASTTLRPTPAGLMSGSITIPRFSPSRAFGVGGSPWGRLAIPTRPSF
jgi:hypothetical protein